MSTPDESYRVRFTVDDDPDYSWLEQSSYDPKSPDYDPVYLTAADMKAGRNPIDPEYYRDPENHLTLFMVVERQCGACETWETVDSLGGIDFLSGDPAERDVDESYDEADFGRIRSDYLRDCAQDSLRGVRAGIELTREQHKHAALPEPRAMIPAALVIECARYLVNGDGADGDGTENPEYTRAIVELVCDLLGYSMDDKNVVAETVLGLGWRE